MNMDPPVKSFSFSVELILGRSFFSKVAEFRNNSFYFIKKVLILGAGITLKITGAGRKRQWSHCQTAKPGVMFIRDHFNATGGADIGAGATADADI